MIITEVLEKPNTYIIDDFLTKREIKDLQSHCNSLDWKKFQDVTYSNTELETTDGYHVMREDYGDIENYFFSKIKQLDLKTPPYFDRVLYNRFKTNENPILHMDSMKNNSSTFILYPNTEWKEDWGGETLLYFIPENLTGDPKKTIPIKIHPKPGRLLIFPGNMLHSGSGTTTDKSRLSMAYQFWNNK